tara:strand:- start:176 stop:2086 length:1911 start_codon:yes stop_codon:yes gene_type:complete
MGQKLNFYDIIQWFQKSEGRNAHLLRRLSLLTVDIFIVLISIKIAFLLGEFTRFQSGYYLFSWINISFIVIGIPLYFFTGQYKGLIRYQGSKAFYHVSLRSLLLVAFVFLSGFILNLKMPNLNDFVLFWILLTGLTSASKFILRDILLMMSNRNKSKKNRVAIYGAGAAGAQLAATLRLAKSHKIEFFLDDNPSLWKRTLNGISILPPSSLNLHVKDINQILIAIPSLSHFSRNKIIEKIQDFGISILQIPAIDELTSGNAKIDSLRPIAIEDLLGREEVVPDTHLLEKAVGDSVICVTGAGGSIGGELCRQIVRLNAKSLVLFEQNEPSLYSIYEELKENVNPSLKIIPILGNILDNYYLQKILLDYKVDVIFHSAAYKHVPMVEENPLKGIENNVLGTKSVCMASQNTNVRKMILISTDKAVRPTNIMGASKRLAELVVLGFAEDAKKTNQFNSINKCYSMVRFGNVLGSSGSVVPLFKKQLAQGGPITLTHNDVVRYFMTLSEASQLVLQASVLAEGGDLFLLDMGEPMLIKELAKKMICLSGLKIKDQQSPNGDIEIITTGLRQGEKLYEELLIDSESKPTSHHLIYRANEPKLHKDKLHHLLEILESSIKKNNLNKTLDTLHLLVPEWVGK